MLTFVQATRHALTLATRAQPHVSHACVQILGEVIKAGATTLNIPDTTGWNLPHEFGNLIAKIKKNTPGAENIIISTHCQNDLGLSTANSLAGAMNGELVGTIWNRRRDDGAVVAQINLAGCMDMGMVVGAMTDHEEEG